MSLTHRWICTLDPEMNYKEIGERLTGYFAKDQGKEHTLKTKISLGQEVVGEFGTRFRLGNMFFHVEHDAKVFDIEDDGTISEEPYVRLDMKFVPFTIVSDPGLIMFNNKQQGACLAKERLSSILYGAKDMIKPVGYDLPKIEADVIKGTFEGMWTLNFFGRDGRVKKGTYYGDDVHLDQMYGQVRGASRKTLGIKMMSSDMSLKVKVGFDGGLGMFARWDQPQDVTKIFEVVKALKPYEMPPPKRR